MSNLIEVNGLGRYFGEIKAVDGLNFKVAKGDVLGFLGPNGAGKSTTMKMLTSYLTPSFGTASVGGFDVVEQSEESRSLIGYLPENAPLYGEMTVRDFLSFITEIREVAPELRKASIEHAIELTSLGVVINQRIETLSKGFKRRVGLAQALLHDPQVLILDEPTDGLDPNQKHEVRELIRKMSKDKCIVLSTHILEEVDAVCNRVVIIANGKIVADSTPSELRKRSKNFGALTLSFRGATPDNAKAMLAAVNGVRTVTETKVSEKSTYFTLLPASGQDILEALLREAEVKKWGFSTLYVDTGHLDEVFRSMTAQ